MSNPVRERYAMHAVDLPQTETPPTLGLGEVVELAELGLGELVLDLGSGPGRDLLAAASMVGPTGRAIGVDFTPEMIERSRRSAADAGLDNTVVLEGELEHLPLPCASVDVVISNCVINLVADKRRALVEAFRVLRPGGRFAVLDTAFESDPGEAVRQDSDAWCSCVGGALVASDYEAILNDIGFRDVSVRFQDASCGEACTDDGLQASSVAVTALKPGSAKAAVRPAAPADLARVESIVRDAGLPVEGLRIEDALVVEEDGAVIGTVALERFGPSTLLRSLAVDGAHRKKGVGGKLVIAALEVARWSGAAEVHLLTEDAQGFFARFGFEPVSGTLVKESCAGSALISGQCCTTATAMRLSFEEADLPLLSKPSTKPLPTFENNACC